MRLLNFVAVLAAAIAVLSAPLAFADDPAVAGASPLDGLRNCRTIVDVAQRAACYDAAVDALDRSEKAGDVAIIDSGTVEKVKREAFGFSMPSLPKLTLGRAGGTGEQIESITGIVRGVGSGEMGRSIVVLDNGQTWRQIDGEPLRIRPGATATIERAALGSFMLKVEGQKRAVRVRRSE
jgi:hypothetical protein